MSYIDETDANAYFATRLYTSVWDDASSGDRGKALAQATRIIDTLAFIGCKTSADQANEFPRGGDTEIPEDIEIACCEIAIELLDGKSPDEEFENLGMISQGYSSVRATYDRSFAPEHLLAGVPSATAWRYLRKYLADGSEVKISRV